MSKYISKNLQKIIKKDAKSIKKFNKIKNLNNKINLTELMNQLSSFFGYRHFNELDNLFKNKSLLEKKHVIDLEELYDKELYELINRYEIFVKGILNYDCLDFYDCNLSFLNLKSKTNSIIHNQNKKGEVFLVDQYKKNNYFKLSNAEMDELKFYCNKEKLDVQDFNRFFNDDGISFSELKKLNVPLRFIYDISEKKTENFFNLLMLMIKEYDNKQRSFLDTFKNLYVGVQIIQGKTEQEKIEIIKSISPEITAHNKMACIDIEDDSLNKMNPNIKTFKKKNSMIETLGWDIRSYKLNILLFNNPNWSEDYEEILKWCQCGYLIIVFTDDDYDHFNLLNDNNRDLISEASYFHIYNTY